MIQVIDRVFNILGHISRSGGLPLGEIAALTGIKKTAAANILRSLLDNGALSKTPHGLYQIGSKLPELCRPLLRQESLVAAANDIVAFVGQVVHETAVVATLVGRERYTLAKYFPDREVFVSQPYIVRQSVYLTASGRVLLAWQPPEEIDAILGEHGLPGDEWPGMDSAATVKDELARIRAEAVYESDSHEATMFACAVSPREGGPVCAIGVPVPKSRLTPEHREQIVETLIRAQSRLHAVAALG